MDSSKKSERGEHVRRDENAILITGGSGFIGRRLVQRLAGQDHTVVCMYHHRLPDPMANVYPVCSDMASAELIAAPLRGVQTVVHLAWESNFVGPTDKVSWNIFSSNLPKNVRLLRNLIQAMERAGTRRLVFVSAMGAGRRATSPFLQEKYLAEFFVVNSKIPEKVIIRSSLVCSNGGANDRFLHSIAKVMQFPAIYPVPKLKEQISPIHVDDLANILAQVVDAPLAQNCAVAEVSGKESFRLDELFRIVSTKLGKANKIALKGFLGTSLLPLFERDKKNVPHQAKLKHYLCLSNKIDENTLMANPLPKLWATEKFRSIKESLLEKTGHAS